MTYDKTTIPLSLTQELLCRLFTRIKVSDTQSYDGIPCWEWMLKPNRDGYGTLTFQNSTFRVHKLLYRIFVEAIPKGLVCDHLCRTRICCNPAHIEIVTDKVNILRGEGIAVQNLAKTHCKNGHLLEGDNLTITTDAAGRKGRRCQQCNLQRYKEFNERLKALPYDHPKRIQYRAMNNRISKRNYHKKKTSPSAEL